MFNFNHRILHILRTLHFVEKLGINLLCISKLFSIVSISVYEILEYIFFFI